MNSQDQRQRIESPEEASALARLRRLLFEREADVIDGLSRKVEDLAASDAQLDQSIRGVAEQVSRTSHEIERQLADRADRISTQVTEVERRVEDVFSRVGTNQHLRASVAQILDGALQDAEVGRHKELSEAVAPLVVNTIKREMVNNRDAMVEALYPITGRLVKAYVANAVKDMMAEINRRLEAGMPGRRLMLRLKSITTGRPMAELALIEAQPFAVEDLFLIDRNDGTLFLHWSRDSGALGEGVTVLRPGSNEDGLLSSYLTAITGFAEEAFKADRASLKTLDLDRYRVFLRASPRFLLAAKCEGAAGQPVEQVIDEAFIGLLESQHDLMARSVSRTPTGNAVVEGAKPELGRLLPGLAEQLEQDIDSKQRELQSDRGGLKPLAIAATLLLAPVLGWYGWQAYVTYQTSLVRETALESLRTTPGLSGYPIRIDVERGGKTLAVSGLVPSDEARAVFVKRMTAKLPGTVVRDELTMLPAKGEPFPREAFDRMRGNIDKLDKRFASQAVARAVARTSAAFDSAQANIAALATSSVRAEMAGVLREIDRQLTGARRRLAELAGDGASVSRSTAKATEADMQAIVDAVTQSLIDANARLVAAHGGRASQSPSSRPLAAKTKAPLGTDATEALIIAAERLEASTQALLAHAKVSKLEENFAVVPSIVQDLNGQIADLRAQIARLKTLSPSPHEAFIAFASSNAIFFSDAIDYREPARAREKLTELAGILRGNDIIVRIVGFTDALGSATRNRQLGIERATKVAKELISLGIPATRIVAVGRTDAVGLSIDAGAGSANRRVGFEIGLRGERTVSP